MVHAHIIPMPVKDSASESAYLLRTPPVFGDLTLGGAELEELKSLRTFGATLDSKLTFEVHMLEVVSKAARSLVSCAKYESY